MSWRRLLVEKCEDTRIDVGRRRERREESAMLSKTDLTPILKRQINILCLSSRVFSLS